MRFDGQLVFVTGGARGIGQAIVKRFADEGASVIFTYRSSESAALQLEADLTAQGKQAKAVALDVSSHDAALAVVEAAVQERGPINVLVNNAGVTEDGFLMLMEESSWDNVIDTNLKGAYNCCKAVLPAMIGKRSGVIVNIASVIGMAGAASQTNYSASKAGLIGLTRALSKEVGGKGIRVNAIAPGYIATDMLEKVPERIRRQFIEKISCGRFGEADEVAKVALFLASSEASYIYGQTIVVDGGMI
ncbi:3-oxoacyl-[acyl-carrier-protein] reductase [Paenibacillus pasadenensis]|uniref:3-oxoacyl-[acyl-carrier-protein] reductase n=1 Tax=Paenibacillus pasadenensis TaxID=217090 RepID=UPI00203B3FE1|nr:3-oxoacyl-[acyl-carrier-protein] reductase [Paenibacillus pasadenensis]MCM3746411.1 3-oxoacyl-[acyl-carrier-protein] reductase [Paenibacillus pasadenensis]